MDVKPARDNWGIREPNFFPCVGRSEENLVWKDIFLKAIQRAGRNQQQDNREMGQERLARWKLPFTKKGDTTSCDKTLRMVFGDGEKQVFIPSPIRLLLGRPFVWKQKQHLTQILLKNNFFDCACACSHKQVFYLNYFSKFAFIFDRSPISAPLNLHHTPRASQTILLKHLSLDVSLRQHQPDGDGLISCSSFWFLSLSLQHRTHGFHFIYSQENSGLELTTGQAVGLRLGFQQSGWKWGCWGADSKAKVCGVFPMAAHGEPA